MQQQQQQLQQQQQQQQQQTQQQQTQQQPHNMNESAKRGAPESAEDLHDGPNANARRVIQPTDPGSERGQVAEGATDAFGAPLQAVTHGQFSPLELEQQQRQLEQQLQQLQQQRQQQQQQQQQQLDTTLATSGSSQQ